MWPNRQFPADLVTITGEILNGKLDFLCSVSYLVTIQHSSKYIFGFLVIRSDFVLTDGATMFESMSVLAGATVFRDDVSFGSMTFS